MSKYTTLYFDLDNTLLDFYAAERSAIKGILNRYSLPADDETAAVYSKINKSYWERFERGEIQKDDIFVNRFRTLLEVLGREGDPEKMSADYFDLLASGHDLMPGAQVIMSFVKGRGYTVCATTNGFARTQYRRIEECGLKHFFDYVFISEDSGHQKPEREYFEYVLENSCEKDRRRVLIIGDSQSSDILGGINAGIDTCWLNPKGLAGEYRPTYEIKSLDELKGIL